MRIVDHKTIDDLAYIKDFKTQKQFEAKQSYFIWASQMVDIGNFKSLKDQIIWECHAENLSRRKISERVGLDDRWISRKIIQIREYLSSSSQCAAYG